LLVLVCGLGYVAILNTDNTILKYALKPATTAFIILLAVYVMNTGLLAHWLVVVGLFFSLIGDVFLRMPPKWFMHGLAAFLLAHIMYILAFTRKSPWGLIDLGIVLILAVIVALYFNHLRKPVGAAGGLPLQIAVIAYMTVISLMIWRAFATGQPMLMVGSLLFYASDAVLAWMQFEGRFRWGEQFVMLTYYGAQFLFALSLTRV
jgi:uncharacterized membrane protein YhhN